VLCVRIIFHLAFHLIFYHRKGDLKTSVRDTERNAVTWGVFPGQEIVQPTIIEQGSFLMWKVRAIARFKFIPTVE